MSARLLEDAINLFQANRFAEASGRFEQVLAESPRDFVALSCLGYIRMQEGRWEEAARILSAATDVEPRVFDVWYHLGSALYQLGRKAESLDALEHAVALSPEHIQALVYRAGILLELGRASEALAANEGILAARPGIPAVLLNRANALAALNRYQEALAAYDAVLAVDAANAQARANRENILFLMRRASRMPADNLRRLFDKYAVNYDEHMVETLIYRGHLHLRALFDRLFPQAKGPLRILDLGSGTGLVGEAFKDLVRPGNGGGGRLDGVDLSPAMNEAARARGIYNDLFLAELETHLMESRSVYDLVLAADTMVYLGDLAPTFTGVAARLVPGGQYIFAVEAKETEGWEQTKANRFRHSLAYLRWEAERAGLEFLDHMDCTIRVEGGESIVGFAVALRKPS